MSNDPSTLAGILSSLQLSYEPFDFAHWIVILSGRIKIKVQSIAEVCVEGNDTESGGGTDSVGTIVLDRVDGIGRQPARPVVSQAVVQPLDVSTRFFGGEQVGRTSLVVADGGVEVGGQTLCHGPVSRILFPDD